MGSMLEEVLPEIKTLEALAKKIDELGDRLEEVNKQIEQLADELRALAEKDTIAWKSESVYAKARGDLLYAWDLIEDAIGELSAASGKLERTAVDLKITAYFHDGVEEEEAQEALRRRERKR